MKLTIGFPTVAAVAVPVMPLRLSFLWRRLHHRRQNLLQADIENPVAKRSRRVAMALVGVAVPFVRLRWSWWK
jgi:hypothetical protein